MNGQMNEWMVPASQRIKKVGRQQAMKIGQVGNSEQFSGEKYKTEICTTSPKHKS